MILKRIVFLHLLFLIVFFQTVSSSSSGGKNTFDYIMIYSHILVSLQWFEHWKLMDCIESNEIWSFDKLIESESWNEIRRTTKYLF